MQISGIVTFQNLGTGFWGIIGDDGQEWRPVNMPDQLKQDGKRVHISIKKIKDDVSIFMWGTPIQIISIHS